MPRTSSGYRTAHRQAGAALVVGLLLLLVLTVLAISGMNTANLDLIMAGNTQYSQNAFEAAESGIEQAIAANDFNPDPSIAPQTQTVTLNDVASYTTTSTPQLAGEAQPALPGSSQDKFSTYHFEIDSTGSSARKATARNVQAVAVIAKADGSFAPTDGGGGGGGGGTKTLE
jgi:type II secretory pathway component PulK